MALVDAQNMILDWFDDEGRDLPWRHTRDPWLILMAELMLQQTQVGRVENRWLDFVRRFPTPSACADTSLAEVLSMWSGLGFNRRAKNLHRCGTEVTERFGGVVPIGLDDLLSLPGVGAYTARAVRVFAFELDDGVLDTNVARILARTSGRRLSRSEAQALADEAVPKSSAWRWNQALLDLGATTCTAKKAHCSQCPMTEICRWGSNQSEVDPAVGSGGVSTLQSKFEGSDRQGRGRLIAALTTSSVSEGDVGVVMGWPDEPARAVNVAAGLVEEELVVLVAGKYELPS